MSARRGRAILIVFPLVAAFLLWPVLFVGEVLLPGRMLPYFAPWQSSLNPPPGALDPWNVLLWDGMAQFYPWRDFLARSMRAGQIPLWDPYQFCGAPFLANSQSAPLYPLHLLYTLPLGAATAVRMGWLAALHLAIAGAGTCAWTRALGTRTGAAALAGVVFMGSGFVITWLELPSLISTACWIPFLLLGLTRAFDGTHRQWPWFVAGALGLMVLGGHLQIAFYGMLAAALLFCFELAASRAGGARRPHGRAGAAASSAGRLLLASAAAGALGLSLAAAQLLPALDFSRVSHRAPGQRQGPRAELRAQREAEYAGYVGLAMHPAGLVTLFAPDYFGHPGNGSYHGFALADGTQAPGRPGEAARAHFGNYTEYAGYIGIAALALALLGAFLGWRVHRQALFLAALALLSLWVATGGVPNRLLYFGVPGFQQSGSPGRILVLFCLAAAVLSGLGAEAVLRALEGEDRKRLRQVVLAGAAVLAVVAAAFALLLASAAAVDARWLGALGLPAGSPALAALLDLRASAVSRAWLLFLVGAGFPLLLIAVRAFTSAASDLPRRLAPLPFLLAVAADLALFSQPFNPTCPPGWVYPQTALTRWLGLQGPGSRFAAVNGPWSVTPREAPGVLPPNAALAYGLADGQGYDSLMLRRYKELVAGSLSPPEDPSPPANGNMVFLKRPDAGAAAMLALSSVVTLGSATAPGFTVATALEGASVLQPQVPVPVARFVREVRTVEEEGALTQMRELAARDPAAFARVAWIQPESALGPTGGPPPADPAWRIEGPGRRRLRIGGGEGGTLLVAENFRPGWRARWQPEAGSPSELRVARANHTFQALQVPPGAGEVLLRYEPFVFRAALFLSLAGVSCLAGFVGWSLVRRTRPTGRAG